MENEAKTYGLLHPDDVLLFHEVAAAMRRVARRYDLALAAVTGHPKPDYRTSPLGDCSRDGHIRLVLRGQAAGQWDAEPRRPEDVWDTAAHELAHLRHHNHGVAFQEFEEEMREAVRNQSEDHREKILRKVVKLQAQRDSEAKLGNAEAAEAFASAVNRMLLDYELSPTDVDYARTAADDPVVEIGGRPGSLQDRDEGATGRLAGVPGAGRRLLASMYLPDPQRIQPYLVRRDAVPRDGGGVRLRHPRPRGTGRWRTTSTSSSSTSAGTPGT
jgi:hypothetical protein